MTANRLLAATLAASLLAAPALAPRAWANDSTAELRTGGLVLTRTDAIEMVSEDLAISRDRVKVRYVFRNTSAADISTVVAFPMPDIEINGIDDMISIPLEEPENFLGFATEVDGAPVTAAVEQKAFRNGVYHTAYLKGLGIPLAAHTEAAREAVDKLPQATRDELVAKELAAIDEYDAGKGWEKHWRPSWTLKTTYHWTQVFPAGRDIVVEHAYRPSVGASAGTMLGSSYMANTPELRQMKARYCVDAAFMAAVEKARLAAGEESSPFVEERIAYVLKTGANWAKPIGDFHLTIDKGEPRFLVSFCATGVSKTGPTTFEVRSRDFTPTRDLDILILQPITPAQ